MLNRHRDEMLLEWDKRWEHLGLSKYINNIIICFILCFYLQFAFRCINVIFLLLVSLQSFPTLCFLWNNTYLYFHCSSWSHAVRSWCSSSRRLGHVSGIYLEEWQPWCKYNTKTNTLCKAWHHLCSLTSRWTRSGGSREGVQGMCTHSWKDFTSLYLNL